MSSNTTSATTPEANTAANKALVRRAIGYNHGAADEGDDIFAPDFVAHMPGQPLGDSFDTVVMSFGVMPESDPDAQTRAVRSQVTFQARMSVRACKNTTSGFLGASGQVV